MCQTSLQQDIYDKNCQLIVSSIVRPSLRSCVVTRKQETTDLTFLKGMDHTAGAGYLCGNRQGCLRGTRKDVLWEIERWLTDERDQWGSEARIPLRRAWDGTVELMGRIPRTIGPHPLFNVQPWKVRFLFTFFPSRLFSARVVVYRFATPTCSGNSESRNTRQRIQPPAWKGQTPRCITSPEGSENNFGIRTRADIL